VLGIVGLHFTAMTAVTLLPDPGLTTPVAVMDRGGLALATSALAAFILLAASGLVLMERFGQRNTFASLRLALNAVPSGLAFFDPSDRLRVWNDAYAALAADFGIALEAGAPRRQLIEAAEAAGWFARLEGRERWIANLDARTHQGATALQLPDGRWLQQESFPTQDGGGVTVLTDISEQKASAVAMAAARDAAEAANRAKSEFLANMSHEIRTPLNGVLGIAEVLLRTDLDDQQRKLVGVIQQSGGLLNGLLSDLIDLAKVEAGMAELRPAPVELGTLVDSVRDLFASRAEDKGLTFRTVVAPDAEADVECDPMRLRQVLVNLVDNAIKFTEAGEVVLAVERTGERVRFEVADTGEGLDAASQASLFQRFRQADSSTTRRHGGAGLGLALCDEYVRLMGGALGCESTLGEGSRFSFELDLPPLAPTAAADGPEAEPLERFNVLVVDDNAVNRQVIELILGSAGIPCASVEDGQQAVEAMTTGDFDAVLMDIQMPVMDGLEATRQIRAWEHQTERGRAPILIVSANCLKEHVDAGRQAGADGHLNKPISAAVLLTALEAQMDAMRKAA
jgi:signal transduction histidine kinase/ActR/RegA family two-component response regulator